MVDGWIAHPSALLRTATPTYADILCQGTGPCDPLMSGQDFSAPGSFDQCLTPIHGNGGCRAVGRVAGSSLSRPYRDLSRHIMLKYGQAELVSITLSNYLPDLGRLRGIFTTHKPLSRTMAGIAIVGCL